MRLTNNIFTILLVVLSIAAPAAARTTRQFRKFFPSWNDYLVEIVNENCSEQLADYQNPENKELWWATVVTDCILDNMSEFRKTEMGISAVVLGLLPTMLQQIGPTVAEVGVLASRRPLLAFLLGFAMPTVATGGPMADPVEGLRRPVRFRMRTNALVRAGWLWVLVSGAEYLVALAALFNTFHQIYELALYSISISAISIYSGPVSQTYAPFLWVALVVPAHVLYFWSFKIQYKPTGKDGDTVEGRSWLQVLATEFIPCAAGDPMSLRQVHTGLLCFSVEFFTDVACLIVFVFGTVALSSQAFISLNDIIPVVARLLSSTLVCRLLILFELHGIREANSSSSTKNDTLLGDGSQRGHGNDTKGTFGGQDQAV